jgi:hypothetical protein
VPLFGQNHGAVYVSTLNKACKLRIMVETTAPAVYLQVTGQNGPYATSNPGDFFVDFNVPRSGKYYTLMYPNADGSAITIVSLE